MTSPIRMTVAALLIITIAAVVPEAASYVLGLAVQSNARPRQAAPPAPADPCAAPANEIVAENCKPGNDSTEWDVNGHGDPSIQGFPTEMSVQPGETINFKIKT